MKKGNHHSVNLVRLDNGIEGLLIHVPNATVMSMQFNFRAGHFLAPEGKWEVPHVMEHLSLGANKQFPKARLFEAEFRKNGAHSNAYTDNYHITYEAECADFEWDRILDMMVLTVTEPLFTEEEFKAEMGNVRDELISRNNNEFRAMAIGSCVKFGLLGMSDKKRVAQMSSVTLKDVKDFYKRTHFTSNMRFIIAGDMTDRQTIVEAKLAGISLPKGDGRIDMPIETPKAYNQLLYMPKRSVQNTFFDIMTFRYGKYNDGEWVAAGLLDNILTGTLYSKILGEAREQGLVYDLGSGFETTRDYISWSLGGQVTSDNLLPVLEIAVREIKKIIAGELDQTDIDAAKQYALGQYQMGGQTVGGVLNSYVWRYFFEDRIYDYYGYPDRINLVEKSAVVEIMRSLFSDKISGVVMLGSAPKELRDAVWQKAGELW